MVASDFDLGPNLGNMDIDSDLQDIFSWVMEGWRLGEVWCVLCCVGMDDK